MSGKPRTGAPTHAGLPALDHVDPQVLRDIATSSPNAASAARPLAAMGATVFTNALGDHLGGDALRSVDACLAGRAPAVLAEAVATEIREACIRIPTGIGAVDLALLRRSGLDVPSAILLAIAHGLANPGSGVPLTLWGPTGDGLPGGSIGLHVRRWDDGPRTVSVEGLELSDGVVWTAGGVLVEGLPDTVAGMIAGRPLRDLVSHPALDGLDLVAGAVRDVPSPPRVHVEALGQPPRLPVETVLADAHPRGGVPGRRSPFCDPTPEERWDRVQALKATRGSSW